MKPEANGIVGDAARGPPSPRSARSIACSCRSAVGRILFLVSIARGFRSIAVASSSSTRAAGRASRRSMPSATLSGEPMLAHKASHEGRTAVDAIAGDRNVAFEPLAIPAVVFTDPEIAWCGLTETEAEKQGRKIAVARFPWGASGRAITLGPDRRLDQARARSGQRPGSRGRHRRRGRRRVDFRRRACDRDGRDRARRRDDDSPPSRR